MITFRSSFLALSICFLICPMRAQIEDVRVETYYISDANDATDEVGGLLETGSRTYRIFLDLSEGCSLLGMYGDTNHVFMVGSTAPFFNNLDRGRTYGHQIGNSALDENTAALDSWLTLGAASNQKYGVEKATDPDGSIIAGNNNDGGSAAISGGLLVNADPAAGQPLTVQDGLMPLNGATVPPNGLYIQGNEPTSVLADSTMAAEFHSEDFIMGCSAPGVTGPTSENVLLLAQLTTMGELRFALNLIIRRADGSIARFVANDSILIDGEQGSALLNYPPVCGCTDPDFLEFDPGAGCDDGSCATTIVFGCLDPLACNYNSAANFDVPQLCCYGIDDCNGLDPDLICPDVAVDEVLTTAPFSAYPNPVNELLHIQWHESTVPDRVRIMDALGRPVLEPIAMTRGTTTLDLQTLFAGPYFLVVEADGRTLTHNLIKQ